MWNPGFESTPPAPLSHCWSSGEGYLHGSAPSACHKLRVPWIKGAFGVWGNPSLECRNASSCEAVTSEIKSSGSTTCGAPLKFLMVSNFLIRSCDLVPSFGRHLVRREVCKNTSTFIMRFNPFNGSWIPMDIFPAAPPLFWGWYVAESRTWTF